MYIRIFFVAIGLIWSSQTGAMQDLKNLANEQDDNLGYVESLCEGIRRKYRLGKGEEIDPVSVLMTQGI
ncbi:MAG: hypothetical protein LBD15_03290 [Holosporales bacterium]|nr:hypothetical protein [Holosporales bacterium]